MRHLAGIVVTTLAVGLAAMVAGCGGGGGVDPAEYERLQLVKEEQARIIDDQKAQIGQLQRRVADLQSLQGNQGNARRLIDAKNEEIKALQRERDAYKQAYEDAAAVIARELGREPPTVGLGAGLPSLVLTEIEGLAARNEDLFTFDPAAARLRFASDALFGEEMDTLATEARPALARLARILAGSAARDVQVTVVGHTDSVPIKKESTIQMLEDAGKSPDNAGLSKLRAEMVASELISGGVSPSRITTEGRGKEQPIASNATAGGRMKNRRVEVVLK